MTEEAPKGTKWDSYLAYIFMGSGCAMTAFCGLGFLVALLETAGSGAWTPDQRAALMFPGKLTVCGLLLLAIGFYFDDRHNP